MRRLLLILVINFLFSATCINNETNWEFEYPDDFFNNQSFYIFLDLQFINTDYTDLLGTGGNCIDPNNEACELNPYSCDVIGGFNNNQAISWAYVGGCDNCDAILVLISMSYNDIYFRYYQSSTNKYFILLKSNGEYLLLDAIDSLEIDIIDDTVYLVECGDANSDGLIDIIDIILIINNILESNSSYTPQIDLNFDYEINILDITIIIQNILDS